MKMPIPPQQPGQHEAFVKLRQANLAFQKALADIPEGLPADCHEPASCARHAACMYLGCSHRAAVAELAEARDRRRLAAEAVNAIIVPKP